jgi:hypothetical protein
MSATAYRVEMIAMPSESTLGGDTFWTLAKDGTDVPAAGVRYAGGDVAAS